MRKTIFMQKIFSATDEEKELVANKVEEAKAMGESSTDNLNFKKVGDVVHIEDKLNGEITEVDPNKETYEMAPVKVEEKKEEVKEEVKPEEKKDEVKKESESADDPFKTVSDSVAKVKAMCDGGLETPEKVKAMADAVTDLDTQVKAMCGGTKKMSDNATASAAYELKPEEASLLKDAGIDIPANATKEVVDKLVSDAKAKVNQNKSESADEKNKDVKTAEENKVEAKAEELKPDVKKDESAKVDAVKAVEIPKDETKKEVVKTEAKSEEVKNDEVKKDEAPKAEAKAEEVKKDETVKPEDKKDEVKKEDIAINPEETSEKKFSESAEAVPSNLAAMSRAFSYFK